MTVTPGLKQRIESALNEFNFTYLRSGGANGYLCQVRVATGRDSRSEHCRPFVFDSFGLYCCMVQQDLLMDTHAGLAATPKWRRQRGLSYHPGRVGSDPATATAANTHADARLSIQDTPFVLAGGTDGLTAYRHTSSKVKPSLTDLNQQCGCIARLYLASQVRPAADALLKRNQAKTFMLASIDSHVSKHMLSQHDKVM